MYLFAVSTFINSVVGVFCNLGICDMPARVCGVCLQVLVLVFLMIE